MSNARDDLDAIILATLSEGPKKFVDIDKFAKLYTPRYISTRLTALKRAGKIEYETRRGWSLRGDTED